MTRLVLFGGSFDPIHKGHTCVAVAALTQLNADQLIFIPAKQSPLKKTSPLASDAHRLTMIQHAIAELKDCSVDDCEFKRPAPSYTLDTIKAFRHSLQQKAELFWLVGADTLPELPHWYRIEELMQLCHLVIMTRGGYETPNFSQYETLWGEKRVHELKKHMIRTPMIEMSSSEIRSKLQQQEDASDHLHPKVLDYIRQHHLYT